MLSDHSGIQLEVNNRELKNTKYLEIKQQPSKQHKGQRQSQEKFFKIF